MYVMFFIVTSNTLDNNQNITFMTIEVFLYSSILYHTFSKVQVHFTWPESELALKMNQALRNCNLHYSDPPLGALWRVALVEFSTTVEYCYLES